MAHALQLLTQFGETGQDIVHRDPWRLAARAQFRSGAGKAHHRFGMLDVTPGDVGQSLPETASFPRIRLALAFFQGCDDAVDTLDQGTAGYGHGGSPRSVDAPSIVDSKSRDGGESHIANLVTESLRRATPFRIAGGRDRASCQDEPRMMKRLRHSLLLLLAALAAAPAHAAEPASNFMRPDRYPAQVTAIDFGQRRVTFMQPIAMEGWQVLLRPQATSEWRDNLSPNGLRNKRGVWIPARCRRDDGPGWRRCGFWFMQVVEMARPRPICHFAVFDTDARRWQRMQIGCPSTLTLAPAAAPAGPGMEPPGSRKGRAP